MNTESRFVAVNLTEAEWRALRAIHADISGWLKQQVQKALEDAGYAARDLAGPAPATR